MVAAPFGPSGSSRRNLDGHVEPDPYQPFRDYYSLGRSDESLGPDGKPIKERELKGGYYEPPHSPFGLIGQIARDTGWSVRRILRTPYLTLMLMMADTPEYIDEKEAKRRYMQRLMTGGQNGKEQKGVDPLTFFTKMARKD